MKPEIKKSGGSSKDSDGLDQKSVVEILRRARDCQRKLLEKELNHSNNCCSCGTDCKNLKQLQRIRRMYATWRTKTKQVNDEIDNYCKRITAEVKNNADQTKN